MRLAYFAVAAGLLVASPGTSQAERPIAKDKYVHDCKRGYILVWAGPFGGRQRFDEYLDFVRLDPETGKSVVTDSAFLRSTNARNQKDAAAINYEGKPWLVQNDRGLYLIPVNPGKWAIGSAQITAFAMGSYAFEVQPCKVTYIGTVLTGFEDGKSEVPEIRAAGEALKGIFDNKKDIPSTFVLRPGALADVPADFPRENLILAQIQRDVRFNNYIAGLAGRAADLGPMGHEKPVKRDVSTEGLR